MNRLLSGGRAVPCKYADEFKDCDIFGGGVWCKRLEPIQLLKPVDVQKQAFDRCLLVPMLFEIFFLFAEIDTLLDLALYSPSLTLLGPICADVIEARPNAYSVAAARDFSKFPFNSNDRKRERRCKICCGWRWSATGRARCGCKLPVKCHEG